MKTILSLIKVNIALSITFTGLVAYLILNTQWESQLLSLVLGLFSIAAGALAFNQVQEHQLDAKMKRTQHRPIPTQKMTPAKATWIASVFSLLGFVLLLHNGLTVALLGLLNMGLYNLMYTKLKPVTVFAVIPGSVVGATPIYMGWLAAGGTPADMRVFFLAVFIVFWQIPHFFLILSNFDSQLKKAQAPNIFAVISEDLMKYVILAWFGALCTLSMLMPMFGLLSVGSLFYVLVAYNALGFGFLAYRCFKPGASIAYKLNFAIINSQMMLVFILLIINAF